MKAELLKWLACSLPKFDLIRPRGPEPQATGIIDSFFLNHSTLICCRMSTMSTLLLVVLLTVLTSSLTRAQPAAPAWATSHRVRPSCAADAPSCTFDLRVDYVVTMAHPHMQNGTLPVSPVYIGENGTATRRSRPGCTVEVELSREGQLISYNIDKSISRIIIILCIFCYFIFNVYLARVMIST